jgi:hypothetical protein
MWRYMFAFLLMAAVTGCEAPPRLTQDDVVYISSPATAFIHHSHIPPFEQIAGTH